MSVEVIRQYDTGDAVTSGGIAVSNVERYVVKGVSNKSAALSADDGTTAVPQVGDPDESFGTLIAIDRNVSRYAPDTWMVEVQYGLPNTPQIQPPPDRDNAQLVEFRTTFSQVEIEVPIITSRTVSVVPPGFVGPPTPDDLEPRYEWTAETSKVLRPKITMLIRVNVNSFDVNTAEAIAAAQGNIHNIGSGGWVFRGGDAQRNKPGPEPDVGPAAITYRWDKLARLPGRPEEVTGDSPENIVYRLAIPPLDVNEVYRVSREFAPTFDGFRPVIEAFQPYDEDNQGEWVTLPGLAGAVP